MLAEKRPRRNAEGLLVWETARYGWSGPCRIVLLLGALAMTSRGARAQDEPSQQPAPQQGNSQPQQSPNEEKKDESPNPAQGAAEKTKAVTGKAGEATKKIGEQALVKARGWEVGCLTGVYVEEGHTMVPLNLKQRREISL